MTKLIQQDNIPDDDNYIFIQEGNIYTNSLYVSRDFGKRHDNVILAIRNISCSDNFRLLNFKESTFKSKQGKDLPFFLLTRKGFIKLAFGFTGAKADKFQEAYIDKFDEMETALNSRALPIPKELTPTQLAMMVIESEKQKELLMIENQAINKELRTVKIDNQIQSKIIENSAPANLFYEAFGQSQDLKTLSQFGKYMERYGLGKNKVYKLLKEHGIITKVDGAYFPTSAYKDCFQVTPKPTYRVFYNSTKYRDYESNYVYILAKGYQVIGEILIKHSDISAYHWQQMNFNDIPNEV